MPRGIFVHWGKCCDGRSRNTRARALDLDPAWEYQGKPPGRGKNGDNFKDLCFDLDILLIKPHNFGKII